MQVEFFHPDITIPYRQLVRQNIEGCPYPLCDGTNADLDWIYDQIQCEEHVLRLPVLCRICERAHITVYKYRNVLPTNDTYDVPGGDHLYGVQDEPL